MAITIEKISYQNKKDARILETVLTNWFKDPKELNLTSPNMSYPFNFKKWVMLTDADQEIHSFVIKSEDWIIGMGNLKIIPDTKRAHAYHIFIDPNYRQQGLAEKMVRHLELLGRSEKMEIMTLRVVPKNKPAVKLYEKLGFEETASSKRKGLSFEKKLN
jgi:ribosomal protein S18 acetylase RimI-like enzyme